MIIKLISRNFSGSRFLRKQTDYFPPFLFSSLFVMGEEYFLLKQTEVEKEYLFNCLFICSYWTMAM